MHIPSPLYHLTIEGNPRAHKPVRYFNTKPEEVVEVYGFCIRTLDLPVISVIIIYLFSVNTFTPIERCAIIFVIAQVGKILIGQKIQKLQNRARCNRSLIGQ